MWPPASLLKSTWHEVVDGYPPKQYKTLDVKRLHRQVEVPYRGNFLPYEALIIACDMWDMLERSRRTPTPQGEFLEGYASGGYFYLVWG